MGYTTRIQNDRYHYLLFESVEYVPQENKDVHKIEFLPTKKVEVATFAMILCLMILHRCRSLSCLCCCAWSVGGFPILRIFPG